MDPSTFSFYVILILSTGVNTIPPITTQHLASNQTITKGGAGGITDWDYCSGSCSEGEGDCDSDSDCIGDLVCGQDNCRDFHREAENRSDCCYHPGGVGGSNDWSYCNGSCTLGQGDCDSDFDCSGSLLCGKDNCRDFHRQAENKSDCCYHPGGYGGPGDDSYCSGSCSEGEGDCDSDSDCIGDLVCGQDNCKDFNSAAENTSDCCSHPGGQGGPRDWSYCSGSCSEGQGDCDHDSDCSGSLVCGEDNCRDFHREAENTSDCCYHPGGYGGPGDDSYCSGSCSEGEGDCDSDSDCIGDLVCGQDNCRDFHREAENRSDCCYHPGGVGGSNDWSYCNGSCTLGQGDCDSDFDCSGSLLCGKDNCRDFHRQAENKSDCCYQAWSGEVMSENYPRRYTNHMDKTYIIEVEAGRIKIIFDHLDIEAHSSCAHDYIMVEDGNGSVLVPRLCGNTLPGELNSVTNKVVITFHSDHTVTGTGFHLTWSVAGMAP